MKPNRGSNSISPAILWISIILMLIGLPLMGIILDGRAVAPYLEFPPLTRYLEHAEFNWRIFGMFSIIDLAMAIALVCFIRRPSSKPKCAGSRSAHRFPVWGWAGAVIMLSGWILAWTRFDWFSPVQKHTFCLPWIGYIVLVNAWCVQRSNASLLTGNPARFLLLFPASALFWWFFEYLNRFVQNWYYVGVEDFNPLSYALFATLAFATVLPAVLSTYRWLLTFRSLNQGLTGRRPVFIRRPNVLAISSLVIAAAGLILLGVLPDDLFALVWVAPLILITAMQQLTGRRTLFAALSSGDWRPVLVPALAALICGFFWEMWNIGSLARWAYAIPFVNRFHVFAMPILGYGGYLPFGLECLVIGKIVMGDRETPPA